MQLKPGYYWIKNNGLIYPARWDGKQWNHEKGVSAPGLNHTNVLAHGWGNKIRKFLGVGIKPLSGVGCPLGCICTQNADGSIKVDCTPS